MKKILFVLPALLLAAMIGMTTVSCFAPSYKYKSSVSLLKLLNLLYSTHKRVFAIEQIEPHTHNSIDIGVALHLYVQCLAIHKWPSFWRL